MAYTAVPASPALAGHVEMLWDCEFPAPAHRFERVLPLPRAQLIINLAENQTRVYTQHDGGALQCECMDGMVVYGPHTRASIIDTAETCAVMGVVFTATGAGALLRQTMNQLRDRHTALADLLGDGIARLRHALLEQRDPQRRLAVLDAWLRRKLRPEPAPAAVLQALQALRSEPGVARIATIVRDTGVSPRRFATLFQQQVGMSAKRYARLLRFQTVVAAAHRREAVDWAAVAADCGFYDQPHLVREFRVFSGLTPGQYLAQQGPWANHVPI